MEHIRIEYREPGAKIEFHVGAHIVDLSPGSMRTVLEIRKAGDAGWTFHGEVFHTIAAHENMFTFIRPINVPAAAVGTLEYRLSVTSGDNTASEVRTLTIEHALSN